MAEVRITEDNERDFEILLGLSKETLDIVMDSLGKSEPGLSASELSKRFHEPLGVDQNDLERLFNLVYGVNRVKLSSGFSSDKVVDDFVRALGETGNERLKRDYSRDYLLRVLSVSESALTTIRATELTFERDKILTDTDVITDVRPVFDGDKIKGLLVIHMLKVEFYDANSESNEIYFALDKGDLKKLSDNISLALSRESSIRTSISGGTFIDIV